MRKQRLSGWGRYPVQPCPVARPGSPALLGDMVAFLADFGFVLRALRPVHSFDGDVVEADAWFTPDITRWRAMSPAQQAKSSLICETCDLLDYRQRRRARQFELLAEMQADLDDEVANGDMERELRAVRTQVAESRKSRPEA